MTRRRPPASTPTDAQHLQRKPERPIPYRWPTRLADRVGGARDGRLAGPQPAGEDAVVPAAHAWLDLNRHRELERQEHETLSHQAVSAQVRIRHTAALADLEVAEHRHAEAAAALADLAQPGEDELGRRGAAESSTPEAVVRRRRLLEFRREHLAPATERVAVAAREVAELNAELHRLIGTLDALERITLTRQVRISEYHARRSATYRRAYLRAVERQARRSSSTRPPVVPPTRQESR